MLLGGQVTKTVAGGIAKTKVCSIKPVAFERALLLPSPPFYISASLQHLGYLKTDANMLDGTLS